MLLVCQGVQQREAAMLFFCGAGDCTGSCCRGWRAVLLCVLCRMVVLKGRRVRAVSREVSASSCRRDRTSLGWHAEYHVPHAQPQPQNLSPSQLSCALTLSPSLSQWLVRILSSVVHCVLTHLVVLGPLLRLLWQRFQSRPLRLACSLAQLIFLASDCVTAYLFPQSLRYFYRSRPQRTVQQQQQLEEAAVHMPDLLHFRQWPRCGKIDRTRNGQRGQDTVFSERRGYYNFQIFSKFKLGGSSLLTHLHLLLQARATNNCSTLCTSYKTITHYATAFFQLFI